MTRPKLLDLFCCAGGAAMGYHRAGFDVVGVDLHPQPRYPFEFHQADAMTYPLDGFDAVHASPPCQAFTAYRRRGAGVGDGYPDLIDATRQRLRSSGLPFVIENVEGAPLRNPITLCGSSFGLDVRRHRLFESNVSLVGIPCDHGRFNVPRYWTGWRPNGEHRLSTVVQVYGNAGGREHWPAALGVDWMTAKEMTECVPPSYTEHIGKQLLAHIEERAA